MIINIPISINNINFTSTDYSLNFSHIAMYMFSDRKCRNDLTIGFQYNLLSIKFSIYKPIMERV